MIQKKGDPTIRLEQYKWASLDCLFIFPIVMSLLIIPLAYKKVLGHFLESIGLEICLKDLHGIHIFQW